VTIDNVDGGYQAAQHLIDLGHRRIAYIGDQSGLQSDAERRAGFKKALRKAGLTIPAEYLMRGDGRAGGGCECALQLLALPEKPTAIFCYNDMTALGAMEAAAAQQVVVGRDLSIVGFDDLFFASFLQPPLTTIRQPKKELGRRATELLMTLLKGGQAERTVVMKGELIARASSTTQGD
jgi:DNA-binding LacI/PurR family transcriptional regulator